ncbi:MAG: alpha/beta fold hydrolase [Burkholderiales bacterium]
MKRTGRLRREGAQIYYEAVGSGPAIVFAHGLGGNHLSWWQQVAHFAERHTCVVFSHRGFPPSSRVPGHDAPDAYADDLAALMDSLDLRDVTLVGQSMGGWTCLEYALRHPERVRALVMASTSGTIDFHQLDDAGVREWAGRAPAAIDAMAARGIHPAIGERMAREQPALAHLYWQILELADAAFREEVRQRLFELRVRAPGLLGELPMPVLFISGEEDRVFAPTASALLARLAPKGEALCLPAAGHSVYFERAAQFNEALGRLL